MTGHSGVSVANTGWTIKFHTGGSFLVSELPDHTAQQPQAQRKTNQLSGQTGETVPLPAVPMDIA